MRGAYFCAGGRAHHHQRCSPQRWIIQGILLLSVNEGCQLRSHHTCSRCIAARSCVAGVLSQPDDVSASSADLLRFRHSQPRLLAQGPWPRAWHVEQQVACCLHRPRNATTFEGAWYVPGQTPNAWASALRRLSKNVRKMTHAAKSRPVCCDGTLKNT